MKQILVIGAGRSTFFLIDYLLKKAKQFGWQITVADFSRENLEKSLEGMKGITTKVLDLGNARERGDLISRQDVVISMAPPDFHGEIAKDCLYHGQHLLTASYLNTAIEGIHQEAKRKGLLFLNEMGLDPGLDHLSTKQAIDNLKSKGAEIKGFHSYTGGLIAPESDDNPWHYKISWNPLNVVKAGQSWARYKAGGKRKVVPYHQLFKRLEKIEIPGYGNFEGYYNRNSLPYEKLYGLEGLQNLVRGTLRKKGFCRAWDLLIQTGLTSDIEAFDLNGKTLAGFIDMFLPEEPGKNLKTRWCHFLGVAENDEAFQKLEWLGLLENKPINLNFATPAEVLKTVLVDKLAMKEDDRDLIAMVHYMEFEFQGRRMQRKSYLTLEGENSKKTAMAKTVGLPLGIATDLLMQNKLPLTGVHLPMYPDIYEPVLEALKGYGILFHEEDEDLESQA